MGGDNLVDMRFCGGVYTGVVYQWHQQWMFKGFLGISIPIIVKVLMICDELLFKVRVYFDGMVSSKKFFSGSSYWI